MVNLTLQRVRKKLEKQVVEHFREMILEPHKDGATWSCTNSDQNEQKYRINQFRLWEKVQLSRTPSFFPLHLSNSFLLPYIKDRLITINYDGPRSETHLKWINYDIGHNEFKALDVVVDSLDYTIEKLSTPKIYAQTQQLSWQEKGKLIHLLYGLGLSQEEIAQEMNFTKAQVYQLGHKQGLSLIQHREQQDVSKVKVVKEILFQGGGAFEKRGNLPEIFQLFHFTPWTFSIFCQKYTITLPKDIIPLPIPANIEKMIEQGKNSIEIANSMNTSHQAALMYLRGAGYGPKWESNRIKELSIIHLDTKKYEQETKRKLIDLLYERITQQAQNESWGVQKATQYLTQREIRAKTIHIFPRLITLFEAYQQAQEKNKPLSLEKLSQKSGIHFSYVGKILHEVGLNTMCRKPVRQTKNKRLTTLRGLELGLSVPDIAYYLSVSERNISQQAYIYHHKSSHEYYLKIFDKRGGRDCSVPFSVASEKYEAADAGFSIEEIRLLRQEKKQFTSPQIIKSILAQREIAQPLIVGILQKLYNDETISMPYKKANW